MPIMHVVRHGRADFGSSNYDNLTETGWQQARQLGAYIKESDLSFSNIFIGAMDRHRQTLEGIFEGMQSSAPYEVEAGLNEYDFHHLLDVWLKQRAAGEAADLFGDPKEYYRAIKKALLEWVDGGVTGGAETYDAFSTRVAEAFSNVRRAASGDCLVISSGGPIAQLVTTTLKAPATTFIELNFQSLNTGWSRFPFSDTVIRLNAFNTVPHLDPDRPGKLTTY